MSEPTTIREKFKFSSIWSLVPRGWHIITGFRFVHDKGHIAMNDNEVEVQEFDSMIEGD